jgi:hypothetical protein
VTGISANIHLLDAAPDEVASAKKDRVLKTPPLYVVRQGTAST